MDLEKAISAHARWRMKFRSAMSKQEQLDVATIAKDNCCELGLWLHGEAKRDYGSLDAYKGLVAKHAAFHAEASKVASVINAKRYIDADRMMATSSPFIAASSEVGIAAVRMKQEAKL